MLFFGPARHLVRCSVMSGVEVKADSKSIASFGRAVFEIAGQAFSSSSNAFASFRVERVEAFGEPAVDRGEKIAGLVHACLDRAKAAPGSSTRAVRRTLPAAVYSGECGFKLTRFCFRAR